MIERKGKQPGKRRRLALSARPIVASVVALLFVLQGLAALASSVARFTRGGEAAFVVSVQGVICAVDAHGGDMPPAHDGDHAQCCTVCGARDFAGVALASTTRISETIPPLQVFVVAAGWLPEAPVFPPTGWASSWSSLAPPHFS